MKHFILDYCMYTEMRLFQLSFFETDISSKKKKNHLEMRNGSSSDDRKKGKNR